MRVGVDNRSIFNVARTRCVPEKESRVYIHREKTTAKAKKQQREEGVRVRKKEQLAEGEKEKSKEKLKKIRERT